MLEVVASVTLGATAISVVAAGFEGVLGPAPTLQANAWLFIMAVGSQIAGWILLSTYIHTLPVTLTSVALLLQPVLAMAWGGLLLKEPIGWPQVAGAGTVLVGVFFAHRAVVVGHRPAVDLSRTPG